MFKIILFILVPNNIVRKNYCSNKRGEPAKSPEDRNTDKNKIKILRKTFRPFCGQHKFCFIRRIL